MPSDLRGGGASGQSWLGGHPDFNQMMAKLPTCWGEEKRSEIVSRYLVPSHSCPYYLLEGERTDEGRDAAQSSCC